MVRLTTKLGICVIVDETRITAQGGPHDASAMGWLINYGSRLSTLGISWAFDSASHGNASVLDAGTDDTPVKPALLLRDVTAFIAYGEAPITPGL